jgi:polysaccharide export outer membrane protein
MAVSLATGVGAAQSFPVYQLGASDVVDIKLVGQPEMETQARVDADGHISVPYLKKPIIVAGGLTTDQVASKIREMLVADGVIKDPHVSVFITTYGQFVSVLGSVTTPGIYPLDHQVRLFDLLARAGGLKPTSASYLTYRHAGAETAKRLDMKGLLEGTDPNANIVLTNGDIVYVPDAPLYYLDGAVNKAGSYSMHDPLTVRQALAQGGGLTPIGSENSLQIVRRSADGKVTKLSVKLDDMVQPNDTIVVSEKLF